jgi:N-acetylmuramoyl-L-alanine amidase
MADRPVIRRGDYGADVGVVQECVGVEPDRDFGPMTEDAVVLYQRKAGLQADGVVGAYTWAAFESECDLPPYPPKLYALTDTQINAICALAANSKIARYNWDDRGVAPIGYIKGMGISYAVAYSRLLDGDPIAEEMARAQTGNSDTDALAWYDDQFDDLDMDNDADGIDTLRHLFMLMLGLGMRESSGAHCMGRDMSADNVSSDTAEAGLFQMSWNASTCSTSMLDLFDAYDQHGNNSNGYLGVFEEDVDCSSSNWANYGSGDGARYQEMAKNLPLFACETVAIGLRRLRQHWGPINRKEVELRSEAEDLFFSVQEIMSGQPIPPEPIPPTPEPIPPKPQPVPPSDVRIVISSGHGLYVRGARGDPVPPQCDEVDEARRIVARVAQLLTEAGVWVRTFNDNTSHDVSTNLSTIINFHNSQTRDLDVSVHLNAYDHSAHGTEVLYVTQEDLAAEVSAAICAAGGFTNRGAKYRSDLAFLNGTDQPAILIETFFCDHTGDCNLYRENVEEICRAIATTIAGEPARAIIA